MDKMSAKSFSEDYPTFTEHENGVVEFESTWSLERVYDKALPIPTQTDPISKVEHKSTSSQEVKHSATQTEPLGAMAVPIKVDEQKLINSLRTLSVLMESEVKIGTTNAFKFQS